jgi:hypothetical protein
MMGGNYPGDRGASVLAAEEKYRWVNPGEKVGMAPT